MINDEQKKLNFGVAENSKAFFVCRYVYVGGKRKIVFAASWVSPNDVLKILALIRVTLRIYIALTANWFQPE